MNATTRHEKTGTHRPFLTATTPIYPGRFQSSRIFGEMVAVKIALCIDVDQGREHIVQLRCHWKSLQHYAYDRQYLVRQMVVDEHLRFVAIKPVGSYDLDRGWILLDSEDL